MPVLSHLFEIYMPTQCKCGKPLPAELQDAVFKETMDEFEKWFGGATIKKFPDSLDDQDEQNRPKVIRVRGIWGSSEEDVNIIYSNANSGQYIAFKEVLPALARRVADRLTQYAVAYSVDKNMRLVNGKPGRCVHNQRSKSTKAASDKRIHMKQRILAALLRLDGISTLRQLFCYALSFDELDQPLSKEKFTESIRQSISEETPIVCAEMSGFKIIHIRLNGDLQRGKVNAVTECLSRAFPKLRALFALSDKNNQEWDFIVTRSLLRKGRPAKIIINRMHVTQGKHERNVAERLSSVDFDQKDRRLTAGSIQKAFYEAFDVKGISEDFFKVYAKVFETVKNSIRGFEKAEDEDSGRHLFSQSLFNRLIFIYFIEKKGWLNWGLRKDYLRALWEDYKAKKIRGSNFYNDRLRALFFQGLNNKEEESDHYRRLIGSVPFLNGGLFEEASYERRPSIQVPDRCFPQIFEELFEKFNFTVSESTPLEQEVAVDPEMLGTIFEELVTGKHEQGAYYTPKPIVSYMCRQALTSYLQRELPKENTIAIRDFIEEKDPSGLSDPEAALKALQTVTVCDPACGSGAYLLGMLHELMELRSALFGEKKLGSEKSYQRKLEIIQRNLYGVDIDPFAVNIARLRLWLSLAVEFDDDALPPPLPNLEFKVEVGDSICGPSLSSVGSLLFRDQIVREYMSLKEQYAGSSQDAEKQRLKGELNEVREEIRGWTPKEKDSHGFDWCVEFAEIFKNGGFDIVITNPPYVRAGLIKNLKPILKRNYPEIYSGMADLYCYFYARAIEILKSGGILTFISSNKWIRAEYGENLRGYTHKNCVILNIVDFNELPVFKKAATFPMVFIAQKKGHGVKQKSPLFTSVRSLDPPYPDIKKIVDKYAITVAKEGLKGSAWHLFSKKAYMDMMATKARGIPLEDYIGDKLYYGIKTGFDDAFVITDKKRREIIKKNPEAAGIIKRMVIGDDVRKWRIELKDRWIIMTKKGIEIEKYPAVLNHLKKWKTQLEKRADQGAHWWELRACAYYDVLESPKILFPEIAKEPRFALDKTGLIPKKTIFSIPSQDLFLLGVLNSKPVWEYLKKVCSVLGDPDAGGRLLLEAVDVSQIPIPKATPAQKKAIEALVNKCLERKGADCQEDEQRLDRFVSVLFK